MKNDPQTQTGLIKEALLVSVGIFILISSGFEISDLASTEWWQNTFQYLEDLYQKVAELVREVWETSMQDKS